MQHSDTAAALVRSTYMWYVIITEIAGSQIRIKSLSDQCKTSDSQLRSTQHHSGRPEYSSWYINGPKTTQVDPFQANLSP